jgi:uncharacterized damage-inducible protein DinB
MKELLMETAAYNRSANTKMLEIIAPLPDAVLTKDHATYYKSIQGTLEHIVQSEILWLKRYPVFFSYPVLADNEIIKTDTGAIKEKIGGRRRECIELMRRVDELFVRFAGGLDENDLSKKVKYTNIKGEEMERTYWKTIFHVLNHGTHHRGEISAMLDMQGISNDFSGFTLYSM